MIDKKEVLSKIKEAFKQSKKRKFTQSVDLSIGLKGLDVKKAGEKVEEIIVLPHERGRKVKLCALVGKEMQTNAKKNFDIVIEKDDFGKWESNTKKTKKLAQDCDFFIAQANIMADVAKSFGRVLGPRGKMPNPKASCVVLPTAKLEVLKERLKKTVVLQAKKGPVLNVRVGREDQETQKIADNIYAIIDQLVKHLPLGEQNIKHVHVKLTMGKSIKVM